MKPRYYGMMQTTWMGTDGFIDGFYGNIVTKRPKVQFILRMHHLPRGILSRQCIKEWMSWRKKNNTVPCSITKY